MPYSQKEAIIDIEEMLTYAENKYNASFKYAGYIAKNGLEPEQLKAYPASGSRDDGCFTVTGTDDGYKDNYVSVYSEDLFAFYVLSGIQELVPEIKLKWSLELLHYHFQ